MTNDEKENFFISPIDKSEGRMYCGPTVLAMLTGKTRAEIHADVNRLKRKAGKKRSKAVYYRDGMYKTTRRLPWSLTAAVKGMRNSHLEKLMKKYSLSPKAHNCEYPSLRRMIEDVGHFKMPIVINVTSHYVLYFQGKIYDTFRADGASIAEHPCAGRRVERSWMITKQKGNSHAA